MTQRVATAVLLLGLVAAASVVPLWLGSQAVKGTSLAQSFSGALADGTPSAETKTIVASQAAGSILAQGAIRVSIDPETTGNGVNTLGTLEDCVRVDVDPASFGDSVADVTIDVVVQGDTQALTAYDAWVIYDPALVDPVDWDDLIKLPDAISFTTKDPPQLNGAVLYLDGGPGIPGDGTILRIDLDVISAGVADFSFYKAIYKSALGGHPGTTGTAMLAVNQDCPTPTVTPAPGTPTPTPPPGTITLVSGWNNSCYVGSEQPIEDALADVADLVLAVYRMRADQGFDRWFPNRPDASTINAVTPYEPLFILMRQQAFWAREPSSTPPASIPLASGWNSVCYTGATKGVQAAAAGIVQDVGVVYTLAPDQTWRRFIPGRPDVSNLTLLESPTHLLILITSENGTLWVLGA